MSYTTLQFTPTAFGTVINPFGSLFPVYTNGSTTYGLESVKYATTEALNTDATGNTLVSQNNESLFLDGYKPSLDDRILVKNQGQSPTGSVYDGIYKLTQIGRSIHELNNFSVSTGSTGSVITATGNPLPEEPLPPVFTGTGYIVTTEEEFDNALYNLAQDGDKIIIPADTTITFTSGKNITKSLEIYGENKDTSKILMNYFYSFITLFNFKDDDTTINDNIYIHDLHIENAQGIDYNSNILIATSGAFNYNSLPNNWFLKDLKFVYGGIFIGGKTYSVKNCTFISPYTAIYFIKSREIAWFENNNFIFEAYYGRSCFEYYDSVYSGSMVFKSNTSSTVNVTNPADIYSYPTLWLYLQLGAQDKIPGSIFNLYLVDNTFSNIWYKIVDLGIFASESLSYYDTLYITGNTINSQSIFRGLIYLEDYPIGVPGYLFAANNTFADSSFYYPYIVDVSNYNFLITANDSSEYLPVEPLPLYDIVGVYEPENWILTRTSDSLKRGSTIPVGYGSINGGTNWFLSTPDPITIGTTPLYFNKFISDNIDSFTVNNLTVTGTFNNFSDKRLKTEINENVPGLDFINKLKPVNYTLIENKTRHSGFIAQDVEEVLNKNEEFNGLIRPRDNENDFYKISYLDFIAPMVKSIKELNSKIDKLQNENQELRDLINQSR